MTNTEPTDNVIDAYDELVDTDPMALRDRAIKLHAALLEIARGPVGADVHSGGELVQRMRETAEKALSWDGQP